MTDARTLYLDLMIKIVGNTIYQDRNQDPKKEKIYSPDLRREGRDWPSEAHSMIGLQRLANLRELCETAIREGIPGDFIETGVWRGGACILMRAVLAAYGAKDRRVFCCDSFEGLPPPSPAEYPVDTGDRHHTYKALAISLDEVKDNFRRYGLLDEQAIFVKGLFKDTLHHIDANAFSLIRLDGDMYESTIQSLNALYPKLTPGGFVIVDDYGALSRCRRAVDEYRAQHGIASTIHHIDWTGIWWRKVRT